MLSKVFTANKVNLQNLQIQLRFRSEFLPKEQCPKVLLLYIILLHDINDIIVLSYGLHIMCNFFILCSICLISRTVRKVTPLKSY